MGMWSLSILQKGGSVHILPSLSVDVFLFGIFYPRIQFVSILVKVSEAYGAFVFCVFAFSCR